MTKEKRYNINFRVVKDSKDKKFKDCLPLEININDDLVEVLKSVCVNLDKPTEHIEQEYYMGKDDNENSVYFKFKRPLIKSFVLSGLSDYKHLLFNTELLKNKKVMIPVCSITIMDSIIHFLKDNIKKLLENIIKTELNINYEFISEDNNKEKIEE